MTKISKWILDQHIELKEIKTMVQMINVLLK